MKLIFLSLFIFLFNFIIYFRFKNIAENFILFDKPDGKLKKHKKPVSLIGGLIILINLYLVIFFLKILNIDNAIFSDNFAYIVLILGSLFFIVGLIDDLKNLSPNTKLILIIFSIILILLFYPEMKLKYIKLTFLEKYYYFNNYSFIFMILSFALLANAINMFDGINLQLLGFTVFVFIIFIVKGFIPIFFILMLISMFFLGLLNYQNKVFLGDGGCYLVSSIIGCSFIYQYKYFENFLFGDEIFIILIVPAIDMLRLFIYRIINQKHPFKGDLNHLHHILDKYTKNKTLTVLITISMCVFPSILMMLKMETYYILILNLIIYISLISYLGYKN